MDGPSNDDSLQGRMIRAAGLDPALYDEVKQDPAALRQAFSVVLLAAVATGIGFGQGDLQLIALGMLFGLLGWALTAYLSWVIGDRIFPESGPRSSPAELLRTIGFANSPAIVRLLAVIPDATLFVMAGTTVWVLFSTVIAIRQGLGYQSMPRAIAVFTAIQVLMIPIALLLATPEAVPPG
ncbi:MAG: hypothetical protein JRG80_17775 [Deltaproteobacteria bacterium]|nr:hypothetical protein [Deltaproteobacteria bacterium]MBW2401085.1 hypothetical protein [Deltaproteobacteria bacterium]MBW2665962.1 hypothetical protein [Deltaproteobacteria bacterium]